MALTIGNVMTKGTHMPNIKAQSLTVRKANVQNRVKGHGEDHTFTIYGTVGKALS